MVYNTTKTLQYYTSLLYSEDSTQQLHQTIQEDLGCVKEWIINCNKFKLNSQKTNLIFFQNRSHHRHFPIIKLDNEDVQQVKQVKFLGIIVDEHLNWKAHIDAVCMKLSKICGLLYRVRNLMTMEALMSVYYIYPLLLPCHILHICMGLYLAHISEWYNICCIKTNYQNNMLYRKI